RPRWRFPRAAVEPEVIGRVVAETGCGFLLDLAHARITAASLGLDPRRYVAALPVHRLCELHVTGLGHDGRRERDHMPLREPDWDLLTWTLDQVEAGVFARPWVLACEYGGAGPAFDWRTDPAVMADQFPRLAALVQSMGARTGGRNRGTGPEHSHGTGWDGNGDAGRVPIP
ncbi:MAG TPA: DUF692 family multinuclear iron-containing protein, partial [Thermaerobacter sp.]